MWRPETTQKTGQNPKSLMSRKTNNNFMKEFLMFDVMITPWIIRILYWVSQIGVILAGLAAFFSPSRSNVMGYNDYGSYGRSFLGGGPFYGLLILIVGSLFLRLFFEMLMVQFKISENTSELKELMKNKDSGN